MPVGALTAVRYSLATGRVRYILDPELPPSHPFYSDSTVMAAHPICKLYPGEGLYAHVSPGDSWNAEVEIQSDISVNVGKHPLHLHSTVMAAIQSKATLLQVVLTTIHDRYVEVDAQNNIVSVVYCDPACGDVGPNGGTLILHDLANSTWTYNGLVFTPPVKVPVL